MSKITPEDAAVCRAALDALKKIAPDGLRKEPLMGIASTSVGRPLLTVEKERVFFTLRDREWIRLHVNTITGMETWIITENGLAAMEAL